MRDEEGRIHDAGVALALPVIFGGDGDVVGLALRDDQRGFLVGFVFGRPPDHNVSLGGFAPTLDFQFLAHLVERESVVVDQRADKLLAHEFFGKFDEPILADVAEDFSLGRIAAEGKRGFIFGVRHGANPNGSPFGLPAFCRPCRAW